MKCLNPLRIRNKYTGEWLYVACRKCSACLVNQSNGKALHLAEMIDRVPNCCLVTLTYDNDCVPCVRLGDSRIYRGVKYPPEIICTHNLDMSKFDTASLLNAPDNNQFVGVLYYKDFQNFLKKLRIYYERKTTRRFPYKYFAVGEYGTNSRRPHFHVVFYGEAGFEDVFESSVCDAWKFHSWSGFNREKGFRYGGSSVANYVASYVNCLTNCNGFYDQKWICQRSVRSKDVGFGIDFEVAQRFEKSLKRKDGFGNVVSDRERNPFEVLQQKRLGSVSTCVVSKRCLSAFFSCPKNLGKGSFSNFLRVNDLALSGKIKDDVGNSIYMTNLSYRRYCSLRGLEQNLSSRLDFIFDSWLYRNMYKSSMIKQSMMEYEKVSDKQEYFRTRINTCVEDLDKRRSRFWFRYRVIPSDYGIDAKDEHLLEDYLKKNEKKLLPKHLKDIQQNGR